MLCEHSFTQDESFLILSFAGGGISYPGLPSLPAPLDGNSLGSQLSPPFGRNGEKMVCHNIGKDVSLLWHILKEHIKM